MLGSTGKLTQRIPCYTQASQAPSTVSFVIPHRATPSPVPAAQIPAFKQWILNKQGQHSDCKGKETELEGSVSILPRCVTAWRFYL